jgi:hypothetical protein
MQMVSTHIEILLLRMWHIYDVGLAAGLMTDTCKKDCWNPQQT